MLHAVCHIAGPFKLEAPEFQGTATLLVLYSTVPFNYLSHDFCCTTSTLREHQKVTEVSLHWHSPFTQGCTGERLIAGLYSPVTSSMVKDPVPQLGPVVVVELRVADWRQVLEVVAGSAIQQVEGGAPDGIFVWTTRPDVRQVLVGLHSGLCNQDFPTPRLLNTRREE